MYTITDEQSSIDLCPTEIAKRLYKPIRHLSFWIAFDLNTFITSTWIGRIDISCAHAWLLSVYEVLLTQLNGSPQCSCAHDMSNRLIRPTRAQKQPIRVLLEHSAELLKGVQAELNKVDFSPSSVLKQDVP